MLSEKRLESEDREHRPYHFYEHKAMARQLHFYISGAIEEPVKYTDMIHQIRSAQPSDVVHIHLNTPGGSVATGVQIISAMRASPAHIITHLESEACSMGALLFLSADEMIVYDDSILMFHNYSGGIVGKGHEIKASVDATSKWYSKLIRNVCIPFLTEDELTRIFEGADLYMLSDEVEARLKHMAKVLAEQEAAKQQPAATTKERKTRSKKP